MPTAPTRRSGVSPRIVGIGVLVPLLALAFGLTVAGDSGDEPTVPVDAATSTTRQTVTTAPIAVGAVPALLSPPRSIRVIYLVEAFRSGTILDTATEVRTARLPFESRVDTSAGAPGEAGESRVVDLGLFGGIETGQLDQPRLTFVAPPGPAARAPILGTDVGHATDAGLIQPVDERLTIAGRECQVLRTGAPADVPLLQESVAAAYVDLCVTDDRIVLQEEWSLDGALFRRRRATSVEVDPVVDPDLFRHLGQRLPEEAGGGRIRRVTDDSRPPDVAFYALADPPAGFAHLGRFGFALDAPRDISPIETSATVVAISDAYASGAEMIAIENGGTTSGSPAFAPDEGSPVDVPSLAGARLVLRFDGAEIRTLLDDGRYVRISGNVSVTRLIAVAEGLQRIEGPGVVEPDNDATDVLDEDPPPAPPQ